LDFGRSNGVDDKQLLADIYCALADSLSRKYVSGEALKLYKEAYAVYEDIGHKRCPDIALLISRYYYHRGELVDSLTWFTRTLQLRKTLGSHWPPTLTIIALVEFAEAKLDSGDVHGAFDVFDEALKLSDLTASSEVDFCVAFVNASLGLYWQRQGRQLDSFLPLRNAAHSMNSLFSEAVVGNIHPCLKEFSKAFCLSRRFDDSKSTLISQFILYSRFGQVLYQLGQFDQASYCLREAKHVATQIISCLDIHVLLIELIDLGEWLLLCGDAEGAQETFFNGLGMIETSNFQPSEAILQQLETGETIEVRLLTGIGLSYYHQSRYDDAFIYLTLAQGAAGRCCPHTLEQAQVLLALGQVYQIQSDHITAIDMFRRAQAIYKDRKVFCLMSHQVTPRIFESYLAMEQPDHATNICELAAQIIYAELDEEEAGWSCTLAITLHLLAKILQRADILAGYVSFRTAYSILVRCLGEKHPMSMQWKLQLETEQMLLSSDNESDDGQKSHFSVTSLPNTHQNSGPLTKSDSLVRAENGYKAIVKNSIPKNVRKRLREISFPGFDDSLRFEGNLHKLRPAVESFLQGTSLGESNQAILVKTMEEWFELTYPATQIFLVICEDISIVSF
jgi:tetratricopeptide (TPR) repeat protein